MLMGVAITIPRVLAGLGDLPFGWEFAVVVILLILVFYIRVHGPGNGFRQKPVPPACQNGAETRDIKTQPGDDETGTHLESSS